MKLTVRKREDAFGAYFAVYKDNELVYTSNSGKKAYYYANCVLSDACCNTSGRPVKCFYIPECEEYFFGKEGLKRTLNRSFTTIDKAVSNEDPIGGLHVQKVDLLEG